MIIEQPIYNGDLIHKRFAYKFFRDSTSPIGDIVSFRAPMKVTDNLIDLEDSLENDFIYSDDAVNFCWEIPNLCPTGAVAFQRYLNVNIARILSAEFGFTIAMRGDDIMVLADNDDIPDDFRKASVSITYSKDNVAIGHTGININAGAQAPDFAFSTELTDLEIKKLIEMVEDFFYNSLYDMIRATTKVIV
jgi:hypothetical protein